MGLACAVVAAIMGLHETSVLLSVLPSCLHEWFVVAAAAAAVVAVITARMNTSLLLLLRMLLQCCLCCCSSSSMMMAAAPPACYCLRSLAAPPAVTCPPPPPHAPPLLAGTLQQAVLCECVSGIVVAAPLVCMTRAHKTADWRLVLTLSVFSVRTTLAWSPLLNAWSLVILLIMPGGVGQKALLVTVELQG